MLSLLLLPPQGEDSSPSAPAAAWVPSTGCSPSGTDSSSTGFPQGHRSCQEPVPVQALHGVTASFGHTADLSWGPFHRLQVDLCSTVDLHGLQGHSLPHRGLLHGLQGNVCLGTWSTSSPPSSLTLVFAEFSSSRLQNALTEFISPSQLRYPRGPTTVTGRLSLGQWQVCLGASWHWLCWTWGKLLAASHRSQPCIPPLATKILPCKPTTACLVIQRLKDSCCT